MDDDDRCNECGEEGIEGETDDGRELCFTCYNEWLNGLED